VTSDLILFDLDGTLVDSLVDIAGAVNHVLRATGGTALSIEEVRGLVGDGVGKLAEGALRLQTARLDTTGAAVAEGIRAFYRAHPCVQARLYPGVPELLRALRARPGLRLGVLTNKLGDVARALLTTLEVADLFDVIAGDGDGHPPKPAPGALLALAARNGTTPARTLMVGDGLPDLGIARNAGARAAAALWGYTPPERLRAEAPALTLDAPLSLLAHV
jgi:phosphoglycolate phosphatase